MKKIFTIDSLVVSLLSAMGYGLGYAIPEAMGAGVIFSLLICIGAGALLEELGTKIIFNRKTQETNTKRYTVFAMVIVLFILAYFIAMKKLGHSLIEDFMGEVFFVVGIPVIGFFVSIVLHRRKLSRLQKKYGDGSNGFQVDEEERARIAGMRERNAEITGAYDQKFAVPTENGIFVPNEGREFLSYLGIPYAKAPVGELRYHAPEPLEKSEKVFEAKYFGPSSPQMRSEDILLGSHMQSEDCLYLNVWKGKEAEEKACPVLVIFSGAGFSVGGSAHPLFSGEEFVKEHPETIVVSFNYRLGLLGFLTADGLPGTENYPDLSTLGLLDQIAALTWIKRNIAAFGGDPGNVTLIGARDYALCIFMLAVCEKAKGLFRRAVLLSGTFRSLNQETFREAKECAKAFFEKFHITCADDLVKIPEEELRSYIQETEAVTCCPLGDGTLFPKDPEQAAAEGKTGDIEFIYGIAKNEMAIFKASVYPESYERWVNASAKEILESSAEEAQKLRDPYLLKEKELGKMAANEWLLETWNGPDAVFSLMEKTNASSGRAYAAYFDIEPNIKYLGSGSVLMAATILGTKEAALSFGTIVNDDLAEIMQALILKFLHGEKPELYQNELDGVEALSWEPGPGVLHVTEDAIQYERSLPVIPSVSEES